MIFNLFVISRKFLAHQSLHPLQRWFVQFDYATLYRPPFSRRGKSIMIPDFSRTPPSLNDRTKHGEASALRSQAVAKGLMVLPWQLLRAYCCTPLADPCSPPLLLTLCPLLIPRSLAWHIYLHVLQVRTSCACTRTLRISKCACVCVRAREMRACVSCIYASMPVVPNPLTCSGQCPEFKDEGSSC